MSESAEPSTPTEPGVVDWGQSSNDESHITAVPQPEPPPNPDNAAVEGDDTPDPPPAAEASALDDDPIGDDEPPAADGDEPPEFWSAEKKALWSKVTDPEVKAAIREHVAEVSRNTARKLEETAVKVRQAEEFARAALGEKEQAVQFWEQNGPVIQQILQGRWAGVNLAELAETNPAEWARVKQAQEGEQRWLQSVVQQHDANRQALAQRQEMGFQQARLAEHQKLAERFPREFGSPDTSKKTYEALGKFLLERGIPADRINAIYEAPVVELVMEAYKYRRLQNRAKEVTTPRPLQIPASKTPTRVVPGAAQRAASPADEATRHAMERLRSGVKLSPEEGALAFR
jgi:hypothetical protein